MDIEIRRYIESEVAQYLPALARLRIEVFREWPYLYDGSAAYEEKYLQSYLAPNAVVVIAFDGLRPVGASTALPVAAHSDVVLPTLTRAGLPVEQTFYFGESVLDINYRGMGIGHRFFDEREAFARSLGYRYATFCAVARPDDHPARPANYRSLDAFWLGRGFVRRPDISVPFRWKDIGEAHETEKPMVFWVKQLAP